MTTGVETFFRSRWVAPPDGVTELEPARLPTGFRAAAVAAGSKPSGRLDVGVLVCDRDDAASADGRPNLCCLVIVFGVAVLLGRHSGRRAGLRRDARASLLAADNH